MGQHSRTVRFAALASALVGLAAVVLAGTATAGVPGDEVDGTPCTRAARACVDLFARQAWLIADGEVVDGPVPISHGGPGRETPVGDFRVQWKDADHRSAEFGGAPMPWAVFFAPGGIAFHEGSLETPSAGCVRLVEQDARAFFAHLSVGDAVQVR